MVSLDVYSTRFEGCRTVYPLRIVRPLVKFRPDHQAHLDTFMSDICSNNVQIQAFIGDNPKRAIARNSKTHASYFPCEYCEAKGLLLSNEDLTLRAKKEALNKQKESILNRIVNARELNDNEELEALTTLLKSVNEGIRSLNRKNNNIVWPSSTMNGPLRTPAKIQEITDKIDQGENLSSDESKGIIGRSLFQDIPYFHVVQDFPVEYLHGVCIGVVKRTTELTFNVGDSRQRNTTRKLSSAESFNLLILIILVPREFSRRVRCLDFSVMKGQEFRNLVLFFFPLVIKCIEPEAGERKLWLTLAYMIRACILPNDEFQNIEIAVVRECGQKFYVLYEELFHPRNCSYNTHVVSSHLPTIRVHGPLTLTSAFGFESFYGEMRHSFTPGTQSPLRQILEKVLIKRAIGPHCCKPSMFFSAKDSPMESNSQIYQFDGNTFHFFKIMHIDDETLYCQKLSKSEAYFPETPDLHWSKVGVFKAGNLTTEMAQIAKNNVSGKFLTVDNLFLTCPANVLEEK